MGSKKEKDPRTAAKTVTRYGKVVKRRTQDFGIYPDESTPLNEKSFNDLKTKIDNGDIKGPYGDRGGGFHR